MASALIDASCFVSLFGTKQPRQQHYRELLQLAGLERWSLSSTWPCVVEAAHLVQPPERYTMLRWIGMGAVAIYPFDQVALLELLPLMQRYTVVPRTEMDLADASLYWLAAETGVRRVFTLDVRDFSRYRLPTGQVFEIL